MKLKRILCGITAAVTLGSFTAMTTSAEDTRTVSVKKLLTVNLNEIEGANAFGYLGDEYFAYDIVNSPDGIEGIKHINIDEWRKTGTFVCSDVKIDLETTGLGLNTGRFSEYSDYIALRQNGENILQSLDRESNTLTSICKIAMWSNTLPDGYTFAIAANDETGALTYAVYAPNGTKVEDTLTYSEDGINRWIFKSPDDVTNTADYKYVGYIIWQTGTSAWDDGFEAFKYDLYGINKNGTRDILYSEDLCDGFYEMECGSNFVSWIDQVRPYAPKTHIYSMENRKTYTIESKFSSLNGNPVFEGRLYGTKGVGHFKQTNYSNDTVTDETYALVDLDTAKVISKSYKYMSTRDGEIYIVQNADDKWGFIDKNGIELAFFDDAGSFIGDYAPVVLNGKGYLIDRNMNKVSEDVIATETLTYDDGLYRFTTSDNFYLVTYSNDTVPVTGSEPSSSIGGYVEPSDSTPSSSASTTESPNGNPGTGVGVVSALPIAAVVGSVIIISKKKK